MKNQLLLLLAGLLPAACTVKKHHAAADMENRFHIKMDEIFNPMEAEGLPGGAVLVEMNGRVLYEKSFGYADFTTREKFTQHTLANLGSVSKTFVAYGILILQNKGKLSADDPIAHYFPDFEDPAIAEKVTIKHLLTHTSGLPDSRPVDEQREFYLTANDEENFEPLKATRKLEFEPGTDWNYSNPAFNALALIIEQASGTKWQDFIATHIFTPAGMPASTITDGAHPQTGVAHAYRFENGRAFEYDYGEYPTFCAAGNGGVWSSVSELRNYYQAIKRHKFLPADNIEQSQNIWYPENWNKTTPPQNGWSWFVFDKSADLPYKMIEHAGDQGGFTAHMAMIPEKDLLILMEFNTERNTKAIRSSILTSLKEAGFL